MSAETAEPSDAPGETQEGRLRVLCAIETIALGGGAEQLMATLLPALRARGVDVELAALCFPGSTTSARRWRR